MKTPEISIELLAPGCDTKAVQCSGTHDDWITSSRVVELKRVSPGLYKGTAAWGGQQVQYKYHLGDWDGVELDAYGGTAGNRYYGGEGPVRDFVPQFAAEHQYHDPAFLPRIERLPPNLPLPAPFATRRIAALLPYDYETSQRAYPVVYLQDGQNLFDEFAPYGNWELDKRLAWLAQRGIGDFIVVAIDHAEEKRIAEYSPPSAERVQRGQSDAYGRFLVEHLKPLIDRTYRTLPGRRHTAIGGSSMGALASLHAAMTQAATFSKVMVLSPSIWVDPDLVEQWPMHEHGDTRVFLYGGLDESPGSSATFASLAQQLHAASRPRRRIYLESHFERDAKHTEGAWGRVFPRAAKYLFA